MYNVRGYIIDQETQREKCVTVLVATAATISEAISDAEREMGVCNIVAANLTKIKEVYHYAHNERDHYYLATVRETEAVSDTQTKRISYQLLFEAPDMETAHSEAKHTLAQGYDMELVSLKRVKYYGVLEPREATRRAIFK